MEGDRLDLSSEPLLRRDDLAKVGRKFLGVQFNCCSVYSRIYINADGTGYYGNCPKCGRRVRIGIDAGGSDQRFFEVN